MLLAGISRIGRRFSGRKIAAPRVDIQAAAARIACIDGKFLRFAMGQDIDEDALDALLVEFIVFAKTNQVAQQAFLLDLRAGIVDLHAAPVRLAGYEAIRFQEVRHQRLLSA